MRSGNDIWMPEIGDFESHIIGPEGESSPYLHKTIVERGRDDQTGIRRKICELDWIC